MSEPPSHDDGVEAREVSAARALHAYRERRRRRRGEDTYEGSSSLLRTALEQGLPEPELDRRRTSILAEAEAEGMPLELAEFLYDVAWEEGLDPAMAYELVRTGLGVAPPEGGVTNAGEAPASDRYLPAWLFPATPTDQMLRERMLRLSFRRLRAFLEADEDVDAAIRRFAAEPDVGHFGY